MKKLRQKYKMETAKGRNSKNRAGKMRSGTFSKIEKDTVNPPSIVDPMTPF